MKKKRIWFAVVFLLVVFQSYTQDQRIFGGDAIDISEAPYQVSLEINGNHDCGGTIIDCEWIITAAHCVENKDPDDIVVHAGSTDQTNNNNGQRIEVAEIIIHDDYSPFAGDPFFQPPFNDIALLRLQEPLVFSNNIQAIDYATPLNTTADDISDGQITFISGWGDAGNGIEDNLRGVSVPISSISTVWCNGDYSVFRPMMIALFGNSASSGNGDSGGPAIIELDGEPILVGVSSWGGCPNNLFPSVYTSVREYSEFIDTNIVNNDCDSCFDFALDYQLVDAYGNPETNFCPEEEIFVDVLEIINTHQYHIDLWIQDGDGDLDWISGAGWVPEASPDGVNIVSLFENDPEDPVTFENDVPYVLKIAVDNSMCGWVEVLKPFVFKELSVSFHLEDENGIEENEFCLGDDIYLDGSATFPWNGQSYFMDLHIVNPDGSLTYVARQEDDGWVNGSLNDPINITKLFENDIETPVTFQPGITYQVKLAIDDQFCGWAQQTQDFIYHQATVVAHLEDENGTQQTTFCLSEDVFLNASATPPWNGQSYFMDLHIVNPDGSLTYVAQQYENGWFNGSLDDPINITHLFENDIETPVTFQTGVVYQVKLAIDDDYCGWAQHLMQFSLEDCCNLPAPTNLQSFGTNLTWDPVLGAAGYLVEATLSWPMNCSCSYPVSIVPILTTATQVTIPIGPNNCTAVQVRTLCADGTASDPSDVICVRPGFNMINSPTSISISPNPNQGRMHIKVDTSPEVESASLIIYSIKGNLIDSFTSLKTDKGVLDFDLDLSSKLKHGVYIFTFRVGNETITKQVIVE